jgi:tRNA A37 threonylcarbamoyladenosine dehydratase
MHELSRFELLIGKSNIDKIKCKNVLLIGLGGVGGYTFESLIRSGIKNITIVDKDKFDITNLNRQVLSTYDSIGKNKVDVAYDRANSISSDVIINKVCKELTLDNINEIDFKDYDYVIDACDTVSIKKEVIRICARNKIKFISCMGTGNKLNPSMLEIVDIRKTSYDPLAKIIRKMVKDEKINCKVPVVCSREVPLKNDSGVIASCSFVPSVAGLLITSYIINDIVGVL